MKFLTYEGSTSLNIFLTSLVTKNGVGSDVVHLVQAMKEGLGIEESSVVFSATPSVVSDTFQVGERNPTVRFTKEGDVIHAKAKCIDLAMWQLGGASVALRLIHLANVRFTLHRFLNLLSVYLEPTRALANTWDPYRRSSNELAELRRHGTHPRLRNTF